MAHPEAFRLKPRVYHRAVGMNLYGDVTAACFKVPRRIDLSKASWTIRDEAVTCPRCRKLIATPSPALPAGDTQGHRYATPGANCAAGPQGSVAAFSGDAG
jgi:hypothetical protein